MNIHDWIDELCDVLDIELDVDESLVQDVATEAADNVGRAAGAVSAFLVGYAAGHQSHGEPDEVERISGLAIDLAQRWDRSADDLRHQDDDPEIEQELADVDA